jgi:hypothetical protein
MATSFILEVDFLIARAEEVGYPEILETNYIIISYIIPMDIKAYIFKTKTKKTFLACLLIMTLLFGRSGPR